MDTIIGVTPALFKVPRLDAYRRSTEHGIVISSFTTLIDALKDQIRTFGADHSAELNRMTKDRERLTAQLDNQQLEIARLKAVQLGTS